MIVAALTAVVWTALAASISAKADEDDVSALADKVKEIECDVDYLGRKAEADLVNDKVNRRILNELAKKAGVAPGGDLEPVRPSEHR